MKPEKRHNELIDQFAQCLTNAAKGLYEAGVLLVQIVDEIPDGLERLRERIPGISNRTIEDLLRVGRGKVFDKLLIAEGPGITRLRKCDIALQRKYYSDPIPVLVLENGKTSELQVSVFDLTPEQCDQVFDRCSIRTLAQQRQWLESRKPKPEPIAIEKPYVVRGGKITFHKPCTLTVQQLSLLLVEATS